MLGAIKASLNIFDRDMTKSYVPLHRRNLTTATTTSIGANLLLLCSSPTVASVRLTSPTSDETTPKEGKRRRRRVDMLNTIYMQSASTARSMRRKLREAAGRNCCKDLPKRKSALSGEPSTDTRDPYHTTATINDLHSDDIEL